MEKKAQKNWILIIIIFILLLIVTVLLLYVLIRNQNVTSSSLPQIADPSAVYCQNSGYQYKIITANDSSQHGACIFPDESECDSWAYYCGCSKDVNYCSSKYNECKHQCA